MKKLVFLVFLFSCFSVLLPNTAFAALDIEWESGDLTGVAIGSSEEASYVVENKNFLCDIEILEVYRAGDTDVFTVSNIPDCLRPRFEPEESGEESIPGYILKPGERCSGLSVSFSPDEVRWFNTELTVRYRDQGSSPPCNTNEQTEIELVPGQGGDATSSQPPSGSSANASFNYTPLEPIPGFESTDTSTLEGFLRGLYLFVMWTVGIAAMFMIMIGGFWYLTSAGNTSRTGEAKKIITNALIGLLVALVTWLLLYVINPDFVNVDLRSLEAIHISSEEGLQYPDDPNAPPAPPGSDTPRPPGPVGGQCAGMDMQAAIYSSQCNDAAPAVLALISCIEEQVPDAQISSISDDQGFTYCQYHWSRPPCAHTDNSCHYGGAAKEPKSCAVDISTRGVGAIALVNAGRSCGAAKVINEGNHVHFSVYGCKCDQHS